MNLRLTLSVFCLMFFVSCVEKGKQQNTESKEVVKKSKILHYKCPNGHGGGDTQGKCKECNAVLEHNQAFHGLNIPKEGIKDPFKGGSTNNSNSTPSPAQNRYGDYHYICSKGHPGGSGSAGDCKTCGAKLTHNDLYHK